MTTFIIPYQYVNGQLLQMKMLLLDRKWFVIRMGMGHELARFQLQSFSDHF